MNLNFSYYMPTRILFGYGKVSDPERVKKFWQTGDLI